MVVIKAGYSAWRDIATELKDVSEKMAELWQNGWSLFMYIIRIRMNGKKRHCKDVRIVLAAAWDNRWVIRLAK